MGRRRGRVHHNMKRTPKNLLLAGVSIAIAIALVAVGLTHSRGRTQEQDPAQGRTDSSPTAANPTTTPREPTIGHVSSPNTESPRPDSEPERAALCARVQGLVVDKAAHKPVPWIGYGPEAGDEAPTPGLGGTTGEDGSFLIHFPRSHSEYRATFVDRDITFARTVSLSQTAADGDISNVTLNVGPTYVLDLQHKGSLDIHRLAARLVTTDPAPHSHAWQALRIGQHPWVRFDSTVITADQGLEAPLLVVSSADGLQRGSTTVPGTRGFFSEPLPIVLHDTGVLTGRIYRTQTEPTCTVHLEVVPVAPPIIAPTVLGPGDLSEDISADAYRIGGLEAGEYVITVTAQGSFPLTLGTVVKAGQASQVDIDLRGDDKSATVKGTIRSSYGRAWRQAPLIELVEVPTQAIVALSSVKDSAPTEANADGSGLTLQGTFELTHVPFGDYVLRVMERGQEGWPRLIWSEPHLRVTTPTASVAVEYRMAQFEVPITFNVVESATQRALPEYGLLNYTELRGQESTSPTNPLFLQPAKHSGKAALTVREQVRLRWMIAVEGFAPAWGDESAFKWNPEGAPPPPCEVILTKGWGGMAIVYRKTSGGALVPLSSASIIVDGREAARTTEEGLASFITDSPAQSLAVAKYGYRLASALNIEQGKPKPQARTFCFIVERE